MKTILLFIALFVSIGAAQEFTKAIEDNSFYIEEAYNQEEHVVQHIINGSGFSPGSIYDASFTQEWPAFGQAHQLSYTIPLQLNTSINPSKKGIGDIMLNYRYQLMNESELAVSPRLSVILPTGDDAFGFGYGVVGAQVNIPISTRISNNVVSHYNIGGTIYPQVHIGTFNATISEFFIGVSTIFLADPNFNAMLEVLFTSSGSSYSRTHELIISPGFRWALNLDDLQIVPGLAFPFSFVSGKQENGVLLYLSFEHPY